MNLDLTDGQYAVLDAFKANGPMTDVALTVFLQQTSKVSMSSSGIRTRRAELQRLGLVDQTATTLSKANRKVAIHDIATKTKVDADV